MRFLRKATAVTRAMGPFLSSVDSVSPVTTLDGTSTLGGRAYSNGTAAAFTPANSAAFAHDANGNYLVALAAGDVPSAGMLRIEFSNPGTFCPVWEDFTVLEAAVYDSLFGTTALSTYAGGAVASVTGAVTVGTNNDKTGYALAVAPPTAAQVRAEMDANSTKLDVAVSTRSTFAGLGSTAPAAWINTAAFAAGATVPRVTLADTLTTYTGNTPQTGDAFAAIGPVATSVGTGLKTELDAVKAKTDTIGSVSDPWTVDVVAGAYTGTQAGALLKQWNGSVPYFTVADTGPTATSFKLDTSASTADGAYVGQWVEFQAGGTLAGQRRQITAYTGATRLCAFTTGFTTAPANGAAMLVI